MRVKLILNRQIRKHKNNFKTFHVTILILFSSIITANAQSKLNGMIVSQQGGPLPYSTISIKNMPIGTISNIEGKFTFSIPPKCMDDTLIISMLGYESLIIPIDGLDTSQNQKFSLREKVFELDEVTISARQMSGEEILKEAFKRQKENLPQTNYLLDLFVRELFYFNDSCNAIVESAAQLFGRKFPRPGFDVYLDHTRYALGRQPGLPTGLKGYNPFREFQSILGGRSRMMKPCKNCRYEIEKHIYVDNQQAAVIALHYESDRTYPVFRYIVGTDNYAILKFEFETKIPFGEAFTEHHNDVTSSLTSLKRTIEYRVFDNRYYLKSYRQWAGHEYRKSDGSMVYHTLHSFLVSANSIQTGNVEKLKADKASANLMDYRSTLFSQSSNNDPAFWENYNVVERTSEEDRLYNLLSEKQ